MHGRLAHRPVDRSFLPVAEKQDPLNRPMSALNISSPGWNPTIWFECHRPVLQPAILVGDPVSPTMDRIINRSARIVVC